MLTRAEIEHSRTLIEKARLRLAHERRLLLTQPLDTRQAHEARKRLEALENRLSFLRAQHQGLMRRVVMEQGDWTEPPTRGA